MNPFNPTDPASFDPGHLSEISDPYPVFDALRAAGPSVQTESGFRVVTGFDAVNEVLRDKRFKSGPIAMAFRMSLPPGAAQDELSHRINFLDPPDHPRVRGLIMRAFTPARVRDMRPWLERKTEELLDAIGERVHDGVNLRAELAHALPSLVISEMLGVPIHDRDQLTQWTEDVTPLLSTQVPPDLRDKALASAELFAAYAAELVTERRAKPGEDLLTAMLQAEDGAERLSREELLSLIVTLYSAGHRTTRDLFTNGLHTLLRHPDMYTALANDPSRAPAAVNEFLRFETPTLYVARVPTEDADIAGEPVSAYTPTLLMLAAANRDPNHFKDAGRFDIARDEGAPVSFAFGPHHCLGAALARMEAEVMLIAVTRRWPSLRGADPDPTWWNSGPFRGLSHLNVRSA
jgi:cytochrome P450